jgi:cobalt/nickel transport protein
MKRKFAFLEGIGILMITAAAFSVIVFGGSLGQFIGTDDQAISAIKKLNVGYKPWFNNIWEPTSSKMESMMFGVQAAVGAGFIIYYVRRKIKCSKKSQPIQK